MWRDGSVMLLLGGGCWVSSRGLAAGGLCQALAPDARAIACCGREVAGVFMAAGSLDGRLVTCTSWGRGALQRAPENFHKALWRHEADRLTVVEVA